MKLYDVIRKEKLKQDIGFDIEPTVVNTPRHIDFETKKFSWKKIAVIGGGLLLLTLIYIVGVKLVHVRVTIVERRIPFSLQGETLELVHEKDANSERLSFQTMVVTDTVTREVYGSDIEPSITSAKGKVVFFNEYSTSTQTVKAGSTLIATSGKRYTIASTVKVPGYTMSGKIKNAGTSDPITVTAVAVGPSYNDLGTSFTVSGWSTAGSKLFYAQSAGAIIGGDDGVAHIVSASDKAQVIATLQAQLTERLKRQTRTQIPDTLITFPELQFVTIDADSYVLKGNSIRFPASVKGTMVTYLISRSLLESAVASHALSDHSYPSVSIPALGDIEVRPITAIPTNPDHIPESITIGISGSGTIITKAPLETIREALIGLSKKHFIDTLSGISEIDTASFTLYPFWSPFFPSKEDRINIVTK